MYADEASFKVSGSTSRTWQLKGKGNGLEVKYKVGRESIKAFGAVSIEEIPHFHFRFAEVFNACTFLDFLKQLVRQYDRKIFLVVDNVRYHFALLIQDWLKENTKKIELIFLPPYSPELNAQEYVWRATRRKSTHNHHFSGKEELKQTLFRRFNRFQGNPKSLSTTIAPFWGDEEE